MQNVEHSDVTRAALPSSSDHRTRCVVNKDRGVPVPLSIRSSDCFPPASTPTLSPDALLFLGFVKELVDTVGEGNAMFKFEFQKHLLD